MSTLRSRALVTATAAAAMLAASPASAADYLFDSNGDNYTLYFNGFGGDPVVDIPGLTSSLLLTLTGGLGTDTLTFSYVLTNTSSAGGASSRVSGFAFDTSGDLDATATGDGTPTGDANSFTNINVNGNYPNSIGNVEVCLTSSNGASCAGGAGGGATLGDPASGSFSLVYDSSLSSVTLNDFYVRYQSLSGLGNITSASGGEIPGVPEPATWAMLLIGFGAIGATLRTKKKSLEHGRLRVA